MGCGVGTVRARVNFRVPPPTSTCVIETIKPRSTFLKAAFAAAFAREAVNRAKRGIMQRSLNQRKPTEAKGGFSAKGLWKEVYDAESKNDIGKGSLRSFPEVPGLRPPPKGPFERKLLSLCQKMRIKII